MMNIYVESNDGKKERDVVSVFNYIERTLDHVINVLTVTRENLDERDEFAACFNILLCKNKLSALLNNLTNPEEGKEF